MVRINIEDVDKYFMFKIYFVISFIVELRNNSNKKTSWQTDNSIYKIRLYIKHRVFNYIIIII